MKKRLTFDQVREISMRHTGLQYKLETLLIARQQNGPPYPEIMEVEIEDRYVKDVERILTDFPGGTPVNWEGPKPTVDHRAFGGMPRKK